MREMNLKRYSSCLFFAILFLYVLYPCTYHVYIGSVPAYFTVLQPALSYGFLSSRKKKNNAILLGLVPSALFLLYAFFLPTHFNSNYGYSIFFTVGMMFVLPHLPKSKHRRLAFAVSIVLLVAALLGFGLYLKELELQPWTGATLYTFQECRLIGSSPYTARLNKLNYGDSPFAYMLHRFGVFPTLLIIVLYISILILLNRRSTVGKLFAQIIGLQLLLSLLYSLSPYAAPFCMYLRVMVPCITPGIKSYLLCLAIWGTEWLLKE